jgi:S1-C subfamily serine protease
MPVSVKMQKLREAKSGEKTSLDSGVVYRYFASYWAKIAKPSLGVHVKVPKQEEANQGLEVLAVLENSPAQAMGLMKGDILLSLGDRSLDNVEHLSQALKQYVGQTVALVYTRNNMRFDEKISLE